MAIRMFRDARIGDGNAIRAINSYGLIEYILLSDLAKFALRDCRVSNISGEEFLTTVIFCHSVGGKEIFYNISSQQRGFADMLLLRMGHRGQEMAA